MNLKRVGGLLFFIIPIFAIAGSALQKEGKKSYPSIVGGIEQFPYPYKISDDKVLVTIIGCGFPSSEKGVAEAQFVELKLVTIEGEEITVMAGGDYVQLSIFWHEVHPMFGKYRFWQPVLELKRKKNGARHWWHEIDLVGRFLVVRDKKDPNKTDHYENEVFHF